MRRLGPLDRLALYSLASVPAALLVVIAAVAATSGDVGAAIETLVPLSVVAIVLAVATVLRGRVPIPVFVLAGLVTLGTAVAGVDFSLRHPEDFAGFVGGLVPIVAFGVTAVAGFVSRRRRRAGARDAPLSGRARRLAVAIPITTVLLILASAVAAVFDEPELASADSPARLVTENDRFVPWDFVVVDGERAEFVVRNIDDYAHTFSIDEFDIDQYIGPRATRRIAFDVDRAPAELRLYCAINGHEAMVGAVSVVDR